MRTVTLSSALMLWLASACGANSTSDAGPFPLQFTTDQCGTDGPTGTQLVNALFSEYGGSWKASPRGAGVPPWTGPTGSLPLALSVYYDGGAIICHPTKPSSCPAGAPCARPLPASITTDISLRFHLADGTFDETFATEVKFIGTSGPATWRASVPASALHGSYPAAQDAGTITLDFDGRFAGLEATGSISEHSDALSWVAGEWSALAGTLDGGVDAGP